MSTHVAVCIPSFDTWQADFGMSLTRMIGHTAEACTDVELSLHNVRTPLLCFSRYSLVTSALAAGASHVLFLDSDMSFPADTLARLLAHRAPFVAAHCAVRKLEVQSNARAPSGEMFDPARQDSGLAPALNVGVAVALIQSTVFLAIRPPWFAVEWSVDLGTFEGEDAGFCRKAIAAGFRPMVDLDLSREIGHVGTCVYTLAGPADRLTGAADHSDVGALAPEPAACASRLTLPGARFRRL